jgi:uncharacterized protein
MRDVVGHLKPIDPSHGFEHAVTVMDIAAKAVRHHEDELTADEQMSVLLAALLHDIDDYKLFPESKDYEHAKKMMHRHFPELEIPVIKMIKLVSCSNNGNRIDDKLPTWYYIPRWADRVEAMGVVGIKRCIEYNTAIGRSEFVPETPRATNLEELRGICSSYRFENYQISKQSRSMIDHMYDKLMHLSTQTNNDFIDNIMRTRQKELENYLLDFGRSGKLPQMH